MELGWADGAIILQNEMARRNQRLPHLHSLFDLLFHLVDFVRLSLQFDILCQLALDQLLLLLGRLLFLEELLLGPSALGADPQHREADALLV